MSKTIKTSKRSKVTSKVDLSISAELQFQFLVQIIDLLFDEEQGRASSKMSFFDDFFFT